MPKPVGPTAQQQAAANRNHNQQSSFVFGDDQRVVNPVVEETHANNTTNSKPVSLTPQQQAAANKNHNQQSSVVFGDGTNYDCYGANKTNSVSAGVKSKQQGSYNPITGQAYDEGTNKAKSKNW